MSRPFCLAFALLLVPVLVVAQNEIQRGEFEAIDLDRKLITLKVGGKQVTYSVDEKTRVFGAENRKFADRYTDLKAGMAVRFKVNDGTHHSGAVQRKVGKLLL